jgi:hypothetical protein
MYFVARIDCRKIIVVISTTKGSQGKSLWRLYRRSLKKKLKGFEMIDVYLAFYIIYSVE